MLQILVVLTEDSSAKVIFSVIFGKYCWTEKHKMDRNSNGKGFIILFHPKYKHQNRSKDIEAPIIIGKDTNIAEFKTYG